jgi:hypothetical protein
MRREIAGSARATVFVGQTANAGGALGAIVGRVAERLVRRRLAGNATVRLDDVVQSAGLTVWTTVTIVGARNTVTAATKRTHFAVCVVTTLDADLAV